MKEFHRRHHLALRLLALVAQFPAAHVVRTGDNAWANAFSYPGTHDVVTNFRFDSQQVASAYTEARGVVGMNPKRIRVRDFIEPLRVGAARVNLYRQAKRRNQNRFTGLEIVGMNVTLDVGRQGELAPTP